MHLSLTKPCLAAAAAISLLAGATSARAQSNAEPEVAEQKTAPLRVEHKGFVNGGMRVWSYGGDSANLVGVELGGNPTNQFALSVDLSTNIEGDPMQVFAARVGMRAYLLPGPVSPYAAARVGMLFGGDDAVGIWTGGIGVELGLEPNGVLVDLGLGKIGAFGEEGVLTEMTLSIGKRF